MTMCARLILGVCVLASWIAAQISGVAYTVTVKADVLDRTFVSMTVSGTAAEGVSIEMPAWSPGAYELRNYWKLLRNVEATDADGKTVSVTHPSDVRWTAAPAKMPVTFTYDRLEPASGLFGAEGTKPRSGKREHVAFNPTDTYAYVVDGKNAPCTLKLVVPDGWKHDVPLAPGGAPGVYTAPDYDTLADATVEMGKLRIHTFTVGGIRYTLTLDRDDPKFPMESVENLLRPIIRHSIGMMGGTAPFERYSFQMHEGPGYGLEHLSSCTIAVPYFLLRQAPGQFDTLFAHEFFHLWNVKRLRPKVLGPFDYTGPCRTKHLWFSEGVTDYYADLICWRTGITKDEVFRQNLLGEIRRLQSNPQRLKESVAAASMSAFDRGYSGLSTLDYYNKGKLVGLCLDLHIRRETSNRKSLDDVMRDLHAAYGLPKAGFGEDELFGAISKSAGVDVAPQLSKWVDGMDELPLIEMLATVGWNLEKRAAASVEGAESRRRRPRDSWSLTPMRITTYEHVEALNAWKADPYTERVPRE